MLEDNFTKKLKLGNIFIPLLIVIISSSLLIFCNYYTIKILSASRAYINGESHYSKGQKDATRHLITYIFTKEETEWKSFKKEIKVPLGDKKARLGLLKNAPLENIEEGLIAGRNNPKDFEDLIWLFKNFKWVPFFARAIKEWEEADRIILKLLILSNQTKQQINNNNLDLSERQIILNKINLLSEDLSINEHKFSESLSNGSRMVQQILLFINILFSLIIIGCVSIYYFRLFKKMRLEKLETEKTNQHLIHTNKKLDKLVYSTSHDLRSPISSLKGLVEMIKNEDNVEEIKYYLSLMKQSLDSQDQFIKDMIDYARNKQAKTTITTVSLNKIIDDAIAQNQFREETRNIHIKKNLSINIIYSDELMLKIIINNLLSNAIKYSDLNKEKPSITISTHSDETSNKISIEDNGIGINKEHQTKIFDMFFVTKNNNKGTGIGLYLVKDTIENLNGKIEVSSEINMGSKFVISLPKKHIPKQVV